jgi:predicted DNA-binding transcriptional regulator YafY
LLTVSIASLPREFDLSERNVYRDLNCLRDAGSPCDHDPAAGGYVIRKGFFMPSIELTVEEAITLSTLLDHVPRDGQIPFFETARQAIDKIRSQLPDPIKEELTSFDGHVAIDLARGQHGDGFRDVYEDVRDALLSRRALRCRYDAAKSKHDDGDAVFEFKPFALWWCQRGWYTVGHHSARNEIRRLKLNRFDYVEITDKPYSIPDDFRLRDHLGLAWRMIRGDTRHKIAIRFEPGFADAASERRWHPTQQEEWHDDDRVTLRFEVDGFEEIVYWVMGYADGATVLEPPELIERVEALAQATARRYTAP